MRRLFWVAVGAAVGIYAVHKVQQVAHAYSPAGLTERAGGAAGSLLGTARNFVFEVRDAMAERESALREALGMADEGSDKADSPRARSALTPAEAAHLIDRPASGVAFDASLSADADRRNTLPWSRT